MCFCWCWCVVWGLKLVEVTLVPRWSCLGVKRPGTTPQGPTTLRVIEEDPKLNPKIAKLWWPTVGHLRPVGPLTDRRSILSLGSKARILGSPSTIDGTPLRSVNPSPVRGWGTRRLDLGCCQVTRLGQGAFGKLILSLVWYGSIALCIFRYFKYVNIIKPPFRIHSSKSKPLFQKGSL